MSDQQALADHPVAHYRFIPGGTAISNGVLARPDSVIVAAVFRQPPPYASGFELARAHLAALGLPVTALCAVELRIREPFSPERFAEFNRGYVRRLADLGLLVNGASPLARTNVAPVVRPPDEPSLYGFCYVAPGAQTGTPTCFVLAGQGDIADGQVVRPGETSPAALREKTEYVLRALGANLARAGLTWADAGQANLYTAHSLEASLVAEVLSAIGPAAVHGLHWHFSRPPIARLELEIDVRNVTKVIYL